MPSGSVTLPVPSGVIEGDVLVFHAGWEDTSTPGSYGLPAGWTEWDHGHQAGTSGYMQGISAYHVVGATAEPDTYTFATPDNVGGGAAALFSIRSTDPALIPTANHSAGHNNTASADPGSVNTTRDAGAVLLLLSTRSNATPTWPAGAVEVYRELHTPATGPKHMVAAALLPVATAGSSGSLATTLSASSAWWMGAVALDPYTGSPPPPPKTQITVNIDETQGGVQITISSDSPDAVTFTVTRTHPSGTTVTLRDANPGTLIDGEGLVFDQEVPIGIPVTYQARAFDAAGHRLGQPSDPAPVFWDTELDWITDPLRPSRGLPCNIAMDGLLQQTFETNAGVHEVEGRPTPVVTYATPRAAAAGTLGLITLSYDEAVRLHQLTATNAVLLLRSSDEETGSMYLAPLRLVENRFGAKHAGERLWQLDYVEVDAPTGPSSGSTYTWQSVIDTYPTWEDLVKSGLTWRDIAEGVSLAADTTGRELAWRGG